MVFRCVSAPASNHIGFASAPGRSCTPKPRHDAAVAIRVAFSFCNAISIEFLTPNRIRPITCNTFSKKRSLTNISSRAISQRVFSAFHDCFFLPPEFFFILKMRRVRKIVSAEPATLPLFPSLFSSSLRNIGSSSADQAKGFMSSFDIAIHTILPSQLLRLHLRRLLNDLIGI